MPHSKREIAILLNENARKVGRRVKEKLLKTYPKIHLYTSKTIEEAKVKVKDLLHRGYERIICGGGDGTLVSFLSHLKEELDEWRRRKGEEKKPPEIGILSLGTGNGCAHSFGAANWKKTIGRIEGKKYSLTPFHPVESEGFLFPFAGLGWDAAVLNNYLAIKKKYEGTKWEKWAKSVLSYLYAAFIKTAPREILWYDPAWCKVINSGDDVYLASRSRGIIPLAIKKGQTIYEGPVNVIIVGTTEFYGYNLKVLPFARTKPGYMQIRIGHVKPISAIAKTISIWKGTAELDGVYDYLVKGVELLFSKPMPYQIGGDAMGHRSKISFKISDLVVELMDFKGPIVEEEVSQVFPTNTTV